MAADYYHLTWVRTSIKKGEDIKTSPLNQHHTISMDSGTNCHLSIICQQRPLTLKI